MDLLHDELRPSDSPYIDHVWRSHSTAAGPFLSMADVHSSLVFTKMGPRTWVSFRGPETKSSAAFGPPDTEWIGVVFRPGVSWAPLPPTRLRDRNDLTLEADPRRGFSWDGSVWETPTFDNIEGLVDRMARLGLLQFDPLVREVLARRPVSFSERTIQRRFHQAAGLLPVQAFQIVRARKAAQLLRGGTTLADAAQAAGYFDQSHMTRSLKHFIGLTPSRVAHPHRTEILSFFPEDAGFIQDGSDSLF